MLFLYPTPTVLGEPSAEGAYPASQVVAHTRHLVMGHGSPPTHLRVTSRRAGARTWYRKLRNRPLHMRWQLRCARRKPAVLRLSTAHGVYPQGVQWMRTDPSAHLPAHSTPPPSQRPSRPCTLRALFADGGALQPSTQALLRFPMGCACDGSLWGNSRAGRLVAPTASPGTSTLPPTHDAPLARAAPY